MGIIDYDLMMNTKNHINNGVAGEKLAKVVIMIITIMVRFKQSRSLSRH